MEHENGANTGSKPNLDDMRMPPVDSMSFEDAFSANNSGNQGTGNKNYVFNNCTVHINEEGRAIGILEEAEKQKHRVTEKVIDIMEEVITNVADMMKKKAETAEKTNKQFIKDLSVDPKTATQNSSKKPAAKNQPVKKAVVKKPTQAPTKK